MFGALITYPLIFVVGYLLLLQIKKSTSGFETIYISFLLGTANVILVLLVFGILGHLDWGVYSLAIEIVFLVFLLQRKGSLSKSKPQNIFIRGRWAEASFILLIAIGISLRFSLLWTHIPNTAWDALKFYLPWSKQLFELNAIPNFDLTFNAGEPFGHSISFVIIGYLLYFLNGGVNEILIYTISPTYALMTSLMIYVFVHKVLKDKKSAYLACAVSVLIPLNVNVGSIPYVEAMLSFYVLAFFLFIDHPNIAGLAAALAILTKYSGFVLPFILVGYMLWKRNVKAIMSTVFIASLFIVPWYIKNMLVYGNPLPFMAFAVKVFEHPPESLNVLWSHWQIRFFDPIGGLVNFLLSDEILSLMSRLVFLGYIFYAALKKKATAFYVGSFLAFLFLFLVSGEHDARYFLPFFPLCLVAFFDIMKIIDVKIGNVWRAAPFDVLMVVFSMTFLSGYASSYLLNTYVLVALLILVLITVLLWQIMRFKQWCVTISLKYIIVAGLTSLIAFSFLSLSYQPLLIVKEQSPNWQSGLIDMINHIKTLPDKNEYHFLTVEDPGIRYYADIRSYELTDPYGAIKLDELFDLPPVQGVFFGADPRRGETRKHTVLAGSNYENVNNVEATVNNVAFNFSGLEDDEYSLIIHYKGSGFIQNRESLRTSNEIWSIFTTRVTANSTDYTLTLNKSSWLMLRFVILVPSKLYSVNYIDWLLGVLEKHDIEYVILSNVLSQVWVHYYYSIFTFIYLPESSTFFERVYTSEYWELYKVR